MVVPLRWVTESYRGMFIHALAFELVDATRELTGPGPKWGYLLGVGYADVPSHDMQYDREVDKQDYYTRAAAEQAAIHYGQRIIDVIFEMR
ncbi:MULTISPECIES: hypothetical protein [Cupriavidus]|uniref:Uncharacterized protein n=1 Tax=Cupriavidus pinatubonensis (strain JMP 134 / LMG 1197) TaxID=264198 RepID=Q46R45_CUPPJ|nr:MULTISPECIES: hypothetical protein [Cupriavidus]QYY27960.1 hypothetical protein K2O51_08530 [Cupriavidus pinatubonensis]TPQ41670.1 hypothetical protein C2U69_07520 [Cupriavidus pinatubonensis]